MSVHSLVTEDFTLPRNKALYSLKLSWRAYWTLCGNPCLYTSGLICSIDGKHLSKTSQVLSFFYREVSERCYGLQMSWNHVKNGRPWNRMWNIRTWSWLTVCNMRSFLTCMMSSIGNLIYQNALQLLFMVASRINLAHGFCNLKSLFRCSKK